MGVPMVSMTSFKKLMGSFADKLPKLMSYHHKTKETRWYQMDRLQLLNVNN